MSFSPSNRNPAAVERKLAELLRAQGWVVELHPSLGSLQPDLVANKESLRYVVEVKSVPEGRPDRVLALLSQAILQVSWYADQLAMSPLAVVHVGHTSASLRQKVEQFHQRYAPNISVGLFSDAGESCFIGPGLDSLNIEAPDSLASDKFAKPRGASDLFSDLNQWMLKVLLSQELPEKLLNAPRREYRSGSEIAEAAQVSAMSASRFVRRMQEEGFLEASGRSLRLVRRGELFRRWQSSAMRSSPELRMSYLIPGAGQRQLHKAASRLEGCIGLFAAADMLQLAHVSGVAPRVYVRRLSSHAGDRWPGLVPVKPGEQAQVILKQPNAPESIFRGAVPVDGMLVSDVLQIWLDASVHPSRGAEQANFLRNKVLHNVLGDYV